MYSTSTASVSSVSVNSITVSSISFSSSTISIISGAEGGTASEVVLKFRNL